MELHKMLFAMRLSALPPSHPMPPKREALTINRNFKVTPTLDAAIDDDAAELGLTDSEYLRLCVYIGGPLLLSCPALKSLNRRELGELAANLGNTLVIQPMRVSLP